MDLHLFRLSDFLRSPGEEYHFARTVIRHQNDLTCHTHDFAEIFWIDKGTGTHYINNNSIPAETGMLVMIRPGDYHTFSASDNKTGIRVTNLAFKKDTLAFLHSRYFSESNTYFWHTGILPFTLTLSAENLKKLDMLSERMLNASRDRMNLDLFLLRIFQIVESEITLRQQSDQAPSWLVSAMKQYNRPEYLKKGIRGFISLTGKTIDHTNRCMKKYFGITLTDYVIRKRIDYAANQIVVTTSPVRQISEECGFNNLGYFYNTFKNHYKMTPVKYRNINQKII